MLPEEHFAVQLMATSHTTFKFLGGSTIAIYLEGVALQGKIEVQIHEGFTSRAVQRVWQLHVQVIRAGYASCTGLSIFLVNALRAAGIPARVTGESQPSFSA